MNLLQEYKCPCCGGAIEFDSTAQKMKCPYCGTEFDMETLQGYAKSTVSRRQMSADLHGDRTGDRPDRYRLHESKTKIGADAVCRRKLCEIKQYEHNGKPGYIPVSHDGTQGKAEIGKRLRRFLLPHILLRANPRRRRRKVLTKQNILRMSAYEYF